MIQHFQGPDYHMIMVVISVYIWQDSLRIEGSYAVGNLETYEQYTNYRL
jgi:hypothetical protein